MKYEDCMNLVEAYKEAVELAMGLNGIPGIEHSVVELRVKSKNVRDYLGEFLGSLVSEGPIGDRRRCDGGDDLHSV